MATEAQDVTLTAVDVVSRQQNTVNSEPGPISLFLNPPLATQPFLINLLPSCWYHQTKCLHLFLTPLALFAFSLSSYPQKRPVPLISIKLSTESSSWQVPMIAE
jgi:hypothetical protein